MYLVVGIGNIGKEYDNTRHNVGFLMLDYYINSKNLNFSTEKFLAYYTEELFVNEKVIYIKPKSYVNLSGEVVRKYVDFYKIPIENILIIIDDINLEIGRLRLREKGTSGGHNGLKNIFLHLGTEKKKEVLKIIEDFPKYNFDKLMNKYNKNE